MEVVERDSEGTIVGAIESVDHVGCGHDVRDTGAIVKAEAIAGLEGVEGRGAPDEMEGEECQA